jgi:hypothetical protein
MATYKRGDRVKHQTRTDWGLGEILDDESGGKVQIIFEDVGVKKFAIASTPLQRVTGDESMSGHLDSLVRAHLKKPGKAKAAATAEYTPFPTAVQNFLKAFPRGFSDHAYLHGPTSEREYKVAARDFLRQNMGRDQLKGLASAGQFPEICALAKKVIGQTNLIHHYEKLWLSNALSSEGRQMLFANQLISLLHGTTPLKDRFEDFVKMLYEIGAAKWTIATYFLFLMFSESEIFVKPEVTKHAARMLGIEVGYQPEVTWDTYERIQQMALELRSRLRSQGRDELAPTDMIDVQSFIWVIGPGYFA